MNVPDLFTRLDLDDPTGAGPYALARVWLRELVDANPTASPAEIAQLFRRTANTAALVWQERPCTECYTSGELAAPQPSSGPRWVTCPACAGYGLAP